MSLKATPGRGTVTSRKVSKCSVLIEHTKNCILGHHIHIKFWVGRGEVLQTVLCVCGEGYCKPKNRRGGYCIRYENNTGS